mmetsp:Transcript_29599/g.85713  ORF Transcript_29599/g.85713 Transcript_29599/m.85713 type:complete len:434 (+) Transcript_29599:670-1971(+)
MTEHLVPQTHRARNTTLVYSTRCSSAPFGRGWLTQARDGYTQLSVNAGLLDRSTVRDSSTSHAAASYSHLGIHAAARPPLSLCGKKAEPFPFRPWSVCLPLCGKVCVDEADDHVGVVQNRTTWQQQRGHLSLAAPCDELLFVVLAAGCVMDVANGQARRHLLLCQHLLDTLAEFAAGKVVQHKPSIGKIVSLVDRQCVDFSRKASHVVTVRYLAQHCGRVLPEPLAQELDDVGHLVPKGAVAAHVDYRHLLIQHEQPIGPSGVFDGRSSVHGVDDHVAEVHGGLEPGSHVDALLQGLVVPHLDVPLNVPAIRRMGLLDINGEKHRLPPHRELGRPVLVGVARERTSGTAPEVEDVGLLRVVLFLLPQHVKQRPGFSLQCANRRVWRHLALLDLGASCHAGGRPQLLGHRPRQGIADDALLIVGAATCPGRELH